MMKLAVIGAPIARSLSPQLHRYFAKQAGIVLNYERILLNETVFEAQVTAFFADGGVGLSVTAPGKVRAFELADIKTKRCFVSGAANTLWRDAHGQIHADNTDGEGLVKDLAHKQITIKHAKILILGAGGAVQNILPSLLAESPQSIHIYNRTPAKAEYLCEKFHNTSLFSTQQTDDLVYDLVLHATGATHETFYALKGQPFCYDLSYDISGVTPFTRAAHQQGLKAIDGFGMLIAQAKAAFALFKQSL